jgi:hypothetical protein
VEVGRFNEFWFAFYLTEAIHLYCWHILKSFKFLVNLIHYEAVNANFEFLAGENGIDDVLEL